MASEQSKQASSSNDACSNNSIATSNAVEMPLSSSRRGDESTVVSKANSQTYYSSNNNDKNDLESKGGTTTAVSGPRPGSFKGNDEQESLAKAVAVLEMEEIYDIAVTPVDPNKKRRFYDNGAFLGYLSLMFFCVAIAIVIAVAVVVSTSDGGDSKIIRLPTQPPTSAPKSLRDVAVIEELTKAIGPKATEPNTPYSTALQWLLEEDPMQLDEFSDHLIQRYIMILFYFQTAHDGAWVSCNPPEHRNVSAECNFMDAERNPDNSLSYYPRNETSIRWLSGRHECEWAQVECLNREVIGLDVYAQNLTGTLPEELSLLTRLVTLSLSLNQFTGKIPSIYGRLSSLAILELIDNLLTGTIPLKLWRHSGLLQFNPSYNMLTGTIPTEIGLMSSLHSLFLFQTRMTGSIPTEIGNLDWSLRTLALYDNRLTGTIPSELFRLTLLEELNLSGNVELGGGGGGPLPSEVGLLKEMNHLSMARTNMNGTGIPEEFWEMTKLETIDIEESLFGGTLSSKIGDLTRLWGVRANRNLFTGTIPTEIGLLQNLQLLWLHINDFTGSVPFSVCSLRGPENLQILNADCRGDNPQVTCQCCTGCCDEQEVCLKV